MTNFEDFNVDRSGVKFVEFACVSKSLKTLDNYVQFRNYEKI